MTDPRRTDAAAGPFHGSDRERNARVEELLLAGLDHYFAGQFDLAINVWTRVLFLDRGHARARAYIERARGAIAERQRHGEELIDAGAAAFERGDVEAARALLLSAVEHGAGNEDAMALLARMDRLAAAGVPGQPRPAAGRPAGSAAPHAPAARAGHLRWAIPGAAALAAVMAAAWALPAPWSAPPPSVPGRVSAAGGEEAVPVPSGADLSLARAHALKERGRLRDALAALDGIRPGDRRGAEADRLKAEIQAALLAASRAGSDGARAPAGSTP